MDEHGKSPQIVLTLYPLCSFPFCFHHCHRLLLMTKAVRLETLILQMRDLELLDAYFTARDAAVVFTL